MDLQKLLFTLKQKPLLWSSKVLKLLRHLWVASKLIPHIIDLSGWLCSKTGEIKKQFKVFIPSFMPYEQNHMNHFLTSNLKSKFTIDHRNLLEQPFTAEELLRTIKNMKNQKALGLDGFPFEFYKKYADLLLELLVQVCNQVIKSGHLALSWTQAVAMVILFFFCIIVFISFYFSITNHNFFNIT